MSRADRPRIAHVSATFPPYSGGTGNVALHNALELARRGHPVTVLTAGPGPGSSTWLERVEVVRLPSGPRLGNAPLTPGLGSALRGFDLVHLHYPYYFGAEQVWLSCRRWRIPYVVTYHQDVIFKGPLDLAARLHHRLVARHILAAARWVAATTLDYAASSRLAALDPGRLVELPNGVDCERFRPDRSADPALGRVGAWGGPTLLFVGGLDRAHFFKGVPILLEALAALPQARLVLVGDGDLRPAYAAQAARLGLEARVRFAGRVSDDELPAYYALADVTVLPSTTRGEAFGLVLLESMASGKPVVASSLPGVRAVVDEGVDGLLVRPGDAAHLAARLRELLEQPGLAARLGQAGRGKAETRYAWLLIGERLERLYQAAVALVNRRG